jgi:hypothetical protein
MHAQRPYRVLREPCSPMASNLVSLLSMAVWIESDISQSFGVGLHRVGTARMVFVWLRLTLLVILCIRLDGKELNLRHELLRLFYLDYLNDAEGVQQETDKTESEACTWSAFYEGM